MEEVSREQPLGVGKLLVAQILLAEAGLRERINQIQAFQQIRHRGGKPF